MTTSFDLSGVIDLRSLGEVAQTLTEVAAGIADRWLIVGATARDLILRDAYGLPEKRKTVDLDIAVALPSWKAFDLLQKQLVLRGAVCNRNSVHEFRLREWTIDVLPFGGVEENGRIVWPTANAMSVVGFHEVSRHALDVLLPGDVRVLVASPAGLLILKLIAWEERHWTRPHHDAVDIRTLIDSYAESWNVERLYEDADEFLRKFRYDNALAAAALLGRDAAAIAERTTLEQMKTILERETSDGAIVFANDMGPRTEENLELLEAVLAGVHDGALLRR